MPGRGVSAEKLESLRRWGAGLRSDPRGEVAAAGRAILILIEEIERLHLLVWDRRLDPDTPLPPPPAPAPPEEARERGHGLASVPRGRLRRAAHAQEAIPEPQSAWQDGF